MTFLHPLLLAAGVAGISIPIIIHLLMHRRRKPVMWGAMRFLVEAYKRQRRRLLIEKWLLLAARCLLILLIAAALGRPLLGALGLVGGGKTVYLVIDNSLAAAVRDDNAMSALDRHKAQAKAVLSTLASSGEQGDRAAIVALASPAEPIVLPASANLASLSALIDQIPLAHARADLPGALSLVAQSIGGVDASGGGTTDAAAAKRSAPDRTFVVLLSDFREGSVDLSPGGDALGAIRLPEGVRVLASEPAAVPATNVGITAVEPLRSGLIDPSKAAGDTSGELVRVTLSRSLDAAREATSVGVRARLLPPEGAGGGPASVESRTLVGFAAGQETATIAVPVRADPGLLKGPRAADAPSAGGSSSTGVLVVQTDDDAIEPDNLWRRPVELREALRVGIIAPIRFGKADRIDKLDPGSWARIALAPGSGDSGGGGIDVVDIEPASLDQARLASLDAVVLPRPDLIPEAGWARVRLFIESGGLALITPPPGIDVHLWGDAMTRGLGVEWSVARQATPQTDQRLSRTQAARTANGLLSLIEGELDELLTAVTIGKTLGLSPAPESGQTLLALDNGAPVLWAGPLSRPAPARPAGAEQNRPDTAAPPAAGRGMVIYLGVALDLDYSDLPAKPLMVPLIQELVRQGAGQARGSWWSLAGTRPRTPARTSELVELPDPARPRAAGAGRDEALARLKVDPGLAQSVEPVRRAGVYRALDESGAARGVVVVNADARGGRTTVQTQASVSAWLRPVLSGPVSGADPIVWLPPAAGGEGGVPVAAAVSGPLGAVDRGSPISLPLLIAALCVALLEVYLARRASHAQLAGPSGSLAGVLGQGRGEAA